MMKKRFYQSKAVEIQVKYRLELSCYHIPSDSEEIYFDEHSEQLNVEVGDSDALLSDLQGRFMFNKYAVVTPDDLTSWLLDAQRDPSKADAITIASEPYRESQQRYFGDPNPEEVFEGTTHCDLSISESIDSIVFS